MTESERSQRHVPPDPSGIDEPHDVLAAEERGIELADPQAREIVYGMPYEEWKSRHQT